MQEKEISLTIPRNPSQIPPSQFRLSRNLKVRGDAIYIIFSGIIGTVFLFFVLMDISVILTIAVSWIPLAVCAWFYFRFVRNRPKYYFDYWLNECFGDRLCSHHGKTARLKVREK